MSKKEETPIEEAVPQQETPAEATAEPAVAEVPSTEEVADSPSELETKLAETEQSLAEKEKQYQYLAAEYDNFRRRSAKEKTEVARCSQRQLVCPPSL